MLCMAGLFYRPRYLVATFCSQSTIARAGRELAPRDCKATPHTPVSSIVCCDRTQLFHSSLVACCGMPACKEGMLQRHGSWRLPQRNVPLVPGPLCGALRRFCAARLGRPQQL
ncbi:hypothetical protein DOTSEDRAFT_70508 [Dothistroma septosporum NZE10]|uniref:Uncharacterized protein n=1 Tax=Dothistroma septosporum (strain NZE10 / CBS 128990) TaxID=675120 RepID=N1PT18_DOTSN|nr:hypothetical protein DOTSEDRAFT_70508 [Dothistroma septosporum NZE10]